MCIFANDLDKRFAKIKKNAEKPKEFEDFFDRACAEAAQVTHDDFAGIPQGRGHDAPVEHIRGAGEEIRNDA